MQEDIQLVIKRVGRKYKIAPKPIKIIIGKILEGNLKKKHRSRGNNEK